MPVPKKAECGIFLRKFFKQQRVDFFLAEMRKSKFFFVK